MFPGSRRLSWQLWASHLTVIAITLVALVGALVLLAGTWLLRQGFVLGEPAIQAQLVATFVGNLVRRDASEARLSELLADLQAGGVQVPSSLWEAEHRRHWFGPPPATRADLDDLDFIVLVAPDGAVLAA